MTLKEADAKLLSPILIPLALIVLLSLLTGCTHVIVMHDPKTGAVAQCNPDPWDWAPQGVAEGCAQGYEKLGWQRAN